jgi:hypothetical protein
MAAGYGLIEAGWMLVFRRAWSAALVLTLAAVASIVAFRSLQGLVGRLSAGQLRSGQLHAEQLQTGSRKSDPRASIDRRSRRLVWLRFSLLTLTPLVSLWLDSERALALILGFSVLPLAIMSEGLLQLAFALIDRDGD